ENGVYRVLEIFKDLDAVVLFPLEHTRPIKPLLTKLSSFHRTIKLGTTTKEDFPLPIYMQVDELDIPHKQKAKRDKNLQIIERIIKDKDFLFEYCISKRSDLLVKYAQNISEHRNTVDRLLQLYWKYGQDKNALLPAYANSGGAGKERKATVPLGAPKRSRTLAVVRSRKYILTEKDKEKIKKSLKKHYLKEGGDSLVETYKKFLRKYFASEVKIAEALDQFPHAPSLRQFAYWKSKLISKDVEIQARTSVRDYLLNKRGTTGSATERSPIPGDVFEIDATVADVHIVSTFSNQRVLGRPTIYSIVDRATRMIVGFHVSLYFASWRAARQALVNCFLPKQEYCSQYGIHISEAEWPCHHIPEELVCDNGEMIGLQPEEHLVPFTQLSFAPPYRPDRKSFVERRFDILNKKAIHPLLGATRRGKVVRGEVDPRKLAIYTLHEVTQ
ncbi:transposase, partial [Vibrio anguillarum]|nr:transposase [Vibrio anguillarum]